MWFASLRYASSPDQPLRGRGRSFAGNEDITWQEGDVLVLPAAAGIRHVDAVLYTHDHADQTHGIDDLRTFATRARKRIPAWMDEATLNSLSHRFDYIFESKFGYPPLLDGRIIPPHGTAWLVEGAGGAIPVTTFDQAHGPIRSVGYRLGDVAYSSDVSDLDEAAFELSRFPLPLPEKKPALERWVTSATTALKTFSLSPI